MEFEMERNGVPIPAEVLMYGYIGYYGTKDWDRWLDDYPEYFAKEKLHRDKWSYVTDEDWEAYYTELREYLDPLDEKLPRSKGIFYWIHHPQESLEWNEEYERVMKEQFEEREDIEERVYNKHFNKYDLYYEREKSKQKG